MTEGPRVWAQWACARPPDGRNNGFRRVCPGPHRPTPRLSAGCVRVSTRALFFLGGRFETRHQASADNHHCRSPGLPCRFRAPPLARSRCSRPSGRPVRRSRLGGARAANICFAGFDVRKEGPRCGWIGAKPFQNQAACWQAMGVKAHAHMLRHACGYKLANDGHDTRSDPGLPRAPQHPKYHPLAGEETERQRRIPLSGREMSPRSTSSAVRRPCL
jgi:hypothetical protein